MKAYLNNILLDWVQVGDKSYPSDVTTHAIDDNSSDSIASHINNGFMTFSIEFLLQGADSETRLDQIRDIRKNKKLCTFSYYEAIDRLVITNITEIKESENSFRINIPFTQIQYATLKRGTVPTTAKKTTVTPKKKTGKQGTTKKKVVKSTVKSPKKTIGGNLSNWQIIKKMLLLITNKKTIKKTFPAKRIFR